MKTIHLYKRQLVILVLLLCVILVLKISGVLNSRESQEIPKQQTDVRAREELCIFGTWEQVEGLLKNEVLTDKGIYRTKIILKDVLYRNMTVVLGEEEEEGCPVIEAVEAVTEKEIILPNIYILEALENGVTVLYKNYRVWLPGTIDLSYDYYHVADVTLSDGAVNRIQIKDSVVRGNVLAVYEDKIELEGYGILPLSEDFKMYEDYEEPREVDVSRLVVGYDVAEFVAAEGRLCAGIIKAQPDITNIRVALGRTGFTGLYHEEIRIVPQGNVRLVKGSQEEQIEAGEELVFTEEDLELEERIYIIPEQEEEGMTITSIERSQGNPLYYGIMEINRRQEGLLLINEVGLETYLCSVVPSEMPASYEPEALKAQAVCARSYAYVQIQESKYQSYGAHVEDSVSSQVYNNIERQDSTTKAVYETAGEVAVSEEQVITAYYFSTSSGYTTTGEIWGGQPPFPVYLVSKAVEDENGEDYEKEEPWYRWTARMTGEDYWSGVEKRAEVLAKASPHLVSVKQADGSYAQKSFQDMGKIQNVIPGETLDGGVVNSVYLVGAKKTLRIDTEYAIRSVLCESGMEITRQDGSVVRTGTLLPSGFFEFEVTRKNKLADAITIAGGGYGHGAGMSQNGANRMALAGKDYEEILTFFYEGISLENIRER